MSCGFVFVDWVLYMHLLKPLLRSCTLIDLVGQCFHLLIRVTFLAVLGWKVGFLCCISFDWHGDWSLRGPIMEAKCSQAVCAESDSIKPGAFSSVTQATLRFLAQEMIMKMVWHLLPMVMQQPPTLGRIFTVFQSVWAISEQNQTTSTSKWRLEAIHFQRADRAGLAMMRSGYLGLWQP